MRLILFISLTAGIVFYSCTSGLDRDINRIADFWCEMAELNERALAGEDVDEELIRILGEAELIEIEMEERYSEFEGDKNWEAEFERKLRKSLEKKGCLEFFDAHF